MQKPLDIRDEQAKELLKNKGIFIVRKSTSAGLTTSVIKNVKPMGLKLAVIEPTHAILADQSKKAADEGIKMDYFRSNKEMCEKVKMLCQAQPWRNEILKCQYIPKECKRCRVKPTINCIYKKLLLDDYDIIGLTYSKLEYMNMEIREKISDCDVILLDEITTALKSPNMTIKIKETHNSYFKDLFFKNFNAYKLNKEYYPEKEIELFDLAWSELIYFVGLLDIEINQVMKQPIKLNGFGAENVIGVIPLHTESLIKNKILNSGNIRILLERYAKIEGFPIGILDWFLDLYAQDYLLVEKDTTNIVIRPIYVDYDIFSQILNLFNPEKQLMIISDASIPAVLNLLLNNYNAKEYHWDDPLKTNQTQFIITDTIKWTSKKQFFNKKEQERDTLGREIVNASKSISRNKLKSYLITPDSISHAKGAKYNYANIAQIDWHKKGILSDSIIIDDYHRSTNARGIKFTDKAILEFHLSRPLIPRNSYTPVCFVTIARNIQPILAKNDKHLTKIHDVFYSPMLCKYLALDNEASAYINRIGRIKDQEGLINSKTKELRIENSIRKTFIVNIGFRKEETLNMLTRTSERPAVIKPFKQGRLFKDMVWITKIIRNTSPTYFKSQAELELEVPLLAYIITECKNREEITGFNVLLAQKDMDLELLKNIVLKHEKLLFKFNIKVNIANRGISFSYIKK